jgi:hypothetical protein
MVAKCDGGERVCEEDSKKSSRFFPCFCLASFRVPAAAKKSNNE